MRGGDQENQIFGLPHDLSHHHSLRDIDFLWVIFNLYKDESNVLNPSGVKQFATDYLVSSLPVSLDDIVFIAANGLKVRGRWLRLVFLSIFSLENVLGFHSSSCSLRIWPIYAN